MKNRLNALAVLSGIGSIISILQSEHYYEVRGGTGPFKSLCNLNQLFNCDSVMASPFSELFLGLPLSSFAAGWFGALVIIALIAKNNYWKRESNRALFAMTAFGTVMSLIYLAIMSAWLRTFCLYCLGVDLINFIGLGIAISLKPEGFRQHKPDLSKWKVFAGLVAGSLFVFPVSLKSMDRYSLGPTAIQEMANDVLNRAPIQVNAGPEFASIGNKDAPITIVEFSDFQCPYCRIGALSLNAVINRYPTQVRVVFRNFPLDPSCNRNVQSTGHPVACETARVAYCSHQKGKFQDVYEKIFENQTSLGQGVAVKYAVEAGLDEAFIKGCVSAPETNSAITRDIEEGSQLGVQSTPTFFINGRKVEGAYPLAVWGTIIEALLKK